MSLQNRIRKIEFATFGNGENSKIDLSDWTPEELARRFMAITNEAHARGFFKNTEFYALSRTQTYQKMLALGNAERTSWVIAAVLSVGNGGGESVSEGLQREEFKQFVDVFLPAANKMFEFAEGA